MRKIADMLLYVWELLSEGSEQYVHIYHNTSQIIIKTTVNTHGAFIMPVSTARNVENNEIRIEK